MWFRRKAQKSPSFTDTELELIAEIRGHVAQIDSLFTQIRLANRQRDRAINKANELLLERNGSDHKYWHPDKDGPYVPDR